MKFERLSKSHLPVLIDFETKNRAWFESLIAPRGDVFYTLQGVRQHITQLTQSMELDLAYSVVLIKDNCIVARANLTEISDSQASVGYRVDKDYINQGYASLCLTELMNKAKDLKIRSLFAKVLSNNPASQRVLQKHGFEFNRAIPNFCIIQNQKFDCSVYRKTFHHQTISKPSE